MRARSNQPSHAGLAPHAACSMLRARDLHPTPPPSGRAHRARPPRCRRRRGPQGRAWGASMLGVCAGSLAFHASSGGWRSLGRKVDYWAIAASSCELAGG